MVIVDAFKKSKGGKMYFPESIKLAGYKSFFDGNYVKRELLDEEEKIKDINVMRKYEDECYAKFIDYHKLPINEKKNILFLMADSTGCGWVRAFLPSKAINENSQKYNATCSMMVCIELMKWADIIVWQRQYQKNLLRFFKTAQDIGKIQLFDTDDNLHRVPDSNPASEVFNPEKEEFLICAGWMKQSDKVIFSVDNLKTFYDKALEINGCVIGNSLPMKYDSAIASKEYFNKRSRIVWAGGSSHIKDLTLIRNPIKRIKEEYGDSVKFTTIGFDGRMLYPVPEDKIPPEVKKNMKEGQKLMKEVSLHLDQDKHVPFMDVTEYVERLCGMSHTIGLCPILDDEFNRCKSPIKFIEYSQAGIATIASNIEPYNKAIVDGETGLLVDNTPEAWHAAIKRLVDDKHLVKRLAKNALEHVKKTYDINKNWVKYEILFDQLMKEREDASKSQEA